MKITLTDAERRHLLRLLHEAAHWRIVGKLDGALPEPQEPS